MFKFKVILKVMVLRSAFSFFFILLYYVLLNNSFKSQGIKVEHARSLHAIALKIMLIHYVTYIH